MNKLSPKAQRTNPSSLLSTKRDADPGIVGKKVNTNTGVIWGAPCWGFFSWGLIIGHFFKSIYLGFCCQD